MRLWPARTSIGLEISDHSLKLVKVVKGKKNSFKIKTQAIEPLPDLAIVEGKIMQPDVIADLLRKAAKRAGARNKPIHFIVPSGAVMVRYMKMPDMPLKKLKKVIQFEIENNIRLPFDDPHYDFVKMERSNRDAASEDNPDEQPQCDVVLTVASKALINQYVHLVVQAGLKPVTLEIKAFALYRLIHYINAGSGQGTCLVVDISDSATELCIYHQGNLRISRNVPLESQLAERTARMSSSGAAGEAAAALFVGHSRDPIQDLCDNLGQEIERLITFYRYSLHYRDESIDRIYICGDMEHSAEITAKLQERLPFSVQLIGTEIEDTFKRGETALNPRVSVPFGTALRGMGR